MTVLIYKGYQASVDFEDERLVIQLLHIDDFVTVECDLASEVQSTFENLVDDYLLTCLQAGKEPSKPYKGSFNIRISPELHKSAAMAATLDHVSLNAWIEKSIEHHLRAPTNRDLIREFMYQAEKTVRLTPARTSEKWVSRRIQSGSIRMAVFKGEVSPNLKQRKIAWKAN